MKMEEVLREEELEELKDNQFDLPDIGKSKVVKTQSSMSTSSLDSGIGLTLKSQYSTVSSLISDLDITGCTIANVPWNPERADLVVKVEQTLFPVHRSWISFYSDVLKNMIFSLNFSDEDTPMITLMEQNVQSIQNLLTYLYFQDKEISEDVVMDLLEISDVFVVEKLTGRCEGFLLSRSSRSPLELLKIGKKYRLKSLLEFALARVSRMPGLLEQLDDADLGLDLENRILRLVIQHYRSSQLECSVHELGDSDCCYEKTKLDNVDFDSSDDDSSDYDDDDDDEDGDDEDSVCYPDCVRYSDYRFNKRDFDISDSEE